MKIAFKVFFLFFIFYLFFASSLYSSSKNQEVVTYQINETEVLSITIEIIKNVDSNLDQIDIPEPPSRESSDPRRILRYFCNAWKDEKFNVMYGAMDKSYTEKVSYEDFVRIFIKDKEYSGGLMDENIHSEESSIGVLSRYKMQLVYNNEMYPPRTVLADVVKTVNGYRITDSGIIPVDFDNL